MRVIVADDITDRLGRLAVRALIRIAVFIHRIEDAPLHRLQPVSGIRQRAVLNDILRIAAKTIPHDLLQRRDDHMRLNDCFCLFLHRCTSMA